MSLDALERSFSGASEDDTEREIDVVHVHGYGVNGTDVRQQRIAQRLNGETIRHTMPHFCDSYDDGDILVKVPIGEQVERLESLLEKMKQERAGVVLSVHSQGTIVAAEALRRLEAKYGELEEAIGLLHTVWMGPVIDTSLEPKRLDAEIETWPAEIDVMQSIQDRLGSEEWPESIEGPDDETALAIRKRREAAITDRAIRGYVHYTARNGTVTDVVIPKDYYESLDAARDRHLDNLTGLWSDPDEGHTVILAGQEEVTDGTLEGVRRTLSYIEENGPPVYVLSGANHRFGGDHRGTIADIMQHRVPHLGIATNLGDRALRLSDLHSARVFA
jgi:hypothetical protein